MRNKSWRSDIVKDVCKNIISTFVTMDMVRGFSGDHPGGQVRKAE